MTGTTCNYGVVCCFTPYIHNFPCGQFHSFNPMGVLSYREPTKVANYAGKYHCKKKRESGRVYRKVGKNLLSKKRPAS